MVRPKRSAAVAFAAPPQDASKKASAGLVRSKNSNVAKKPQAIKKIEESDNDENDEEDEDEEDEDEEDEEDDEDEDEEDEDEEDEDEDDDEQEDDDEDDEDDDEQKDNDDYDDDDKMNNVDEVDMDDMSGDENYKDQENDADCNNALENSNEDNDIENPEKRPRLDASAKAEARKNQKLLRLERKSKDKNFELVANLKQNWESLRQNKLDTEVRKNLVAEMMNQVKGYVSDIIFKHDASRVIQSLVKHGGHADRELLHSELKGRFVELCKSLYGRFLIQGFLKHSPKLRKPILQEFYTHIPQLVRHLIASYTIEKIYGEYASTTERYEMLQELYHPEFRRFKTKDKLSKIIETREKSIIMQTLMATIKPVVEKGILGDLTIVQQAALDYLSLADEAAKREFLTTIHPVAILHTREGAKLAIAAIAVADARERKKILREFRTFAAKIATEEFGHAVMLEAFDTVDDTVLISSTVGRELIDDAAKLDEILDASSYARRVALFAVVGRTSRLFAPSQLEVLCSNGKKDAFKRQREIRVIFADALLATAMRKARTWFSDAERGAFCVELFVRAAATPEASVSELAELVHGFVMEASAAGDLTGLRMVKRLLQYERSWQLNSEKAKIPEGYSEEGREQIRSEIAERCKTVTTQVFAKFTLEELLTLITSAAGAFVALAFCEDKHTGPSACAMLKKHAAKILKAQSPASKIIYEVLTKSKAKK